MVQSYTRLSPLHLVRQGTGRCCALSLLFLSLIFTACGAPSVPLAASASGSSSAPVTLRLGYFPNVTHATGLVGAELGIFQRNLPPNVTLQTLTFNAGPSAIEALFADGVDATYIGPNPALNGYIRSRGEALRVIAGGTSGGASLIVRPEIASVSDLRGKQLGTPQLGNTQDVALRHWLQTQGLRTTTTGAGDVAILPQENAQILEGFRAGRLDGAWVPEPWATRLRLEGGGKQLLDERELWPEGQFVTTHLIVSAKFLRERPEVVEALLRGHVETTRLLNAEPARAQQAVNTALTRLSGRGLDEGILAEAWGRLVFTNDPIGSSLRKSAQDAADLGLLELGGMSLDQVYDLRLLNQVLKIAGEKEVAP